ncbi:MULTISPECIES: MFS transporter [Paenibacillus]|jgi:predicted MFS family arabinose efflux permease|uniref:MFS transporter n=1 Tax=Paenibacillus odorifer TaxID=189426 RepID=A0A1R0XT82_9BACL|nr:MULTISPECIES: MFS transporter [Paenibacillus]AWV33973.1 MFS transporter [Paenibacillus odorifer]MDH6430517.1 putative MFS family arabinose efflux permease [Paenibacillus sp. PastH-4]MDH6443737.1 putative MFS family arabinose efflux permease [Paenibacillus sp. PastF-4]MDH6527645.1 putative MFS family arabinose efflux permease [Paenibacillus sp. PastH-3]OMC80784.1 MFS transporter [Paenibacillus odorifer]
MTQSITGAAVRVGEGLSKQFILILAIASGLSVANMYYNQPLLAEIGRTFNASSNAVGYVSMLTQIGYALGMLFFVPLGDIRERRTLISGLLIAVSLSLIGFATAQNLTWMYIASFAIGITTVVPQVIIPLSAELALPEERGKVIGTVMSGLFFGILLARTISGIIGDMFGWRAMYWIAAVVMLLLSLILYRLIPATKPDNNSSYSDLLKSMGQLIRRYSTLRESSLIGACMFGGFSVFWTSLAFFLEGEPYHYSSSITGLFGLIGVAGAAGAPFIGRLADRIAPKKIVGILLLITLIAYGFFGLAGFTIWSLIAGVIILDLGVQGSQVSNQTRIYALEPAARSRINTVFMVSTFTGGAIGSTLGSFAWQHWGWSGVCLMGGTLVVAALCIWIVYRVIEKEDIPEIS